jgi:hypothetical protein
MKDFENNQEVEKAKIIYQRILAGDPVNDICADMRIEHNALNELFHKYLELEKSGYFLKIKGNFTELEAVKFGLAHPNWSLDNLDLRSEDLCVRDAIKNPEILKAYEKTGIFRPIGERELITESILFAVLNKHKQKSDSHQHSSGNENIGRERMVAQKKQSGSTNRKIKNNSKKMETRKASTKK